MIPITSALKDLNLVGAVFLVVDRSNILDRLVRCSCKIDTELLRAESLRSTNSTNTEWPR